MSKPNLLRFFKLPGHLSQQKVKSVYFGIVKATLTELRRKTSKFVRPVIHGGKTLTLTEHGKEVTQILPAPQIDRKAAGELLRSIGPVKLPRK
jgi:prevent-host-death family protein